MKVNEVSQITKIHHETIRMYRKKGFLQPAKNPVNGYYDYSIEDIVSLMYLKKMRSCNLPLKLISKMYNNGKNDLDVMIDDFDTIIDDLKSQVSMLERRIELLKFTRNHINDSPEKHYVVQEIESIDNKIDFYNLDPSKWKLIHDADLYAITLRIKKEYLNDKNQYGEIPCELGFGAYEHHFKTNRLPIPEDAVICPKGKYLTSTIELENFNAVDQSLIAPMQDYAKMHNYHFISDTTAFLIKIDLSKGKKLYTFRLRAQVEALINNEG